MYLSNVVINITLTKLPYKRFLMTSFPQLKEKRRGWKVYEKKFAVMTSRVKFYMIDLLADFSNFTY